MQTVKGASGFGLIEVLIVVVVFSVAMTSIAYLNTWLGKQATHIAKRSQLAIFRSNILALVMDNPSWSMTVTKLVGSVYVNPDMATCLTGGGGASAVCIQYRATVFDLYDSSGTLVYKSRGTNTDGVTLAGVPCGPNSPAGIPYTTYVYPSTNCPFRYRLFWAPMNRSPFTTVAVIATLEVGRVGGTTPAVDFIVNPAKFSYPPLQANGIDPVDAATFFNFPFLAITANRPWPSTLIYRNALP
jgi:prepilin-type N-terminal cleavage/methylation domain-containing protein